eukprot:374289-Prymnesium_polylepis.2
MSSTARVAAARPPRTAATAVPAVVPSLDAALRAPRSACSHAPTPVAARAYARSRRRRSVAGCAGGTRAICAKGLPVELARRSRLCAAVDDAALGWGWLWAQHRDHSG